MKKYAQACYFAAEKHKDQRRKDENKTPYINHPLEVANILATCGVVDENILCAAVLHDTIEDTKTTREELAKLFGEKVTKIVEECSDDKDLSKVKRKQIVIEHADKISTEAKLVKLADKYSNMTSLIDHPPASWSPAVIRGYIVWSYAVYLKCRRFNSQLDAYCEQFFKERGVLDMTEEELHSELENYYGLIGK